MRGASSHEQFSGATTKRGASGGGTLPLPEVIGAITTTLAERQHLLCRLTESDGAASAVEREQAIALLSMLTTRLGTLLAGLALIVAPAATEKAKTASAEHILA